MYDVIVDDVYRDQFREHLILTPFTSKLLTEHQCKYTGLKEMGISLKKIK